MIRTLNRLVRMVTGGKAKQYTRGDYARCENCLLGIWDHCTELGCSACLVGSRKGLVCPDHGVA